MAKKHDKEGAQKRILSTCVRLFLEQGYSKTTPKQIMQESQVSTGCFYNIFKSKSDVLTALCEFMFENQFTIAGKIVGEDASKALLYAVETSIQITLAELNENLRDIYVEVYTDDDLLDLIHHKTAKKIGEIFASYLPDNKESDFYEMEIGSAGIIRAYMAKPCDMYFTLEKKLQRFLNMSLKTYSVPEDEIQQIVAVVLGIDIRNVAESVMHELFSMLEMKFDFKFTAVE